MDRLIDKIKEKNNPTVAGLDPKLEFIPSRIKSRCTEQYGNTMKAAAEALYKFNIGLIDAICDIVPAVKPQCAYYEMYGFHGVEALYKTIAYAKQRGMYVITDGKRNDIGSTMDAYAIAHLGETELFDGKTEEAFGADALTVNGYLGSDGINPLLQICKDYGKSIFVLVKTSNPSSGELQDKLLDGRPMYEEMGNMCQCWGEGLIGKYGYSPVGAVVGATYPEQLAELRKAMPHTFFLVPGYGAQGGGAKDISGAFSGGIGAVVNNSRGIMCAYKKHGAAERDYAKAAREEALRMRDDINSVI